MQSVAEQVNEVQRGYERIFEVYHRLVLTKSEEVNFGEAPPNWGAILKEGQLDIRMPMTKERRNVVLFEQILLGNFLTLQYLGRLEGKLFNENVNS